MQLQKNNLLNVLIVEDDADDIDISISAIKDSHPHTKVISFRNGKKLLSELAFDKMTHLDIIFLDINMPYVNGIECLKELRNNIRFHRIPIIMLTTSSTQKDIMETFYAGASRFITKPHGYAELVNLFDQVLELALLRKLYKPDLFNFVMQPLVKVI